VKKKEFNNIWQKVVIALCLGLTCLCSLGLTQIKRENNGMKLWVPVQSSQR
jgi:hypothetical protein